MSLGKLGIGPYNLSYAPLGWPSEPKTIQIRQRGHAMAFGRAFRTKTIQNAQRDHAVAIRGHAPRTHFGTPLVQNAQVCISCFSDQRSNFLRKVDCRGKGVYEYTHIYNYI